MVLTLFFDSYAFFEIIEGNINYSKYANNVAIVTTKFNLMELHYGLLAKYGKETADKYYDDFVEYTIDIQDEVIKKANELRLSLKRQDLSYVDCIGYIIAQRLGIKFLTGDKQFQNMDNVEFVK